MTEEIVGIDLGTTNSEIALYRTTARTCGRTAWTCLFCHPSSA